MAQPIFCDVCGAGVQADTLLTDLNSGQVNAFCAGHFGEFVFQMASQMVEAQAASDLAEKLEQEPPGDPPAEGATSQEDKPDDSTKPGQGRRNRQN